MEDKTRTPTPRLNFTIRTIEALPPAPADSKSGRVEYLDTEAPGLYLRVTKNGVRTFSFFGRAKGARKAERFTIGRFPIVKPEQARQEAWKLAGEQAKGTSVTKAARDRRGEMTLDTLKEKYVADMQKRKARGVQAFEELYERHIQPYFGKLRLSDIEAEKVGEWHQKLPSIVLKLRQEQAAERAARAAQRRREIEARHAIKGRKHGPVPKPRLEQEQQVSTSTVVVTGRIAANRALEALRAMFNWGAKPVRSYFTATNPATGHTKYPKVERERFLRPGEASSFFQALADEPNVTARDCMMMKLLTGGRRGNVHAMRWDQVDFGEQVWHIPTTKNGTPQYVPLVPEAIALLKQRYETRTSDVWVFPADRSDSKNGHIGNLKKAWHRVMVRSGLSNLRQHDLRRTLGSWQARQGATLLLIGKSLNHKHPASTAIYARLDIEPVRASVEQATAAMFEAAGLKEPAKVIPLPVNKKARNTATASSKAPAKAGKK
ncbi:tyrosine-type recombinase/integrase [Caenimonas soli]|uniref:tyrosine-type recombinase/integrase n=1 Tax=Caenimonas soli TaxID=2735555 RepID=UPI001553A7E5|nr:site-specific integrase [Caenimonas soli]NPC57861.1 tyrosine-type recombinase/integrase [Caenimonas soli]